MLKPRHGGSLLGALVLLGASVIQASAQTRSALDALDAEIPDLMTTWKVPGLSLAIVKNGEVILSRGYGVLEVGTDVPVNDETLFAIGSITKSFTAACLGMLVNEGTIGWDDPVSAHLSDFVLKDPWITRNVTIRDFLGHRSGISADNLVFWGTALGRDELVRRMRYLDISGFRSSFQYNNLAYLTAGQVIPAASGQSWDDCVHDRIFGPLRMQRSTVHDRDLAGDTNVASAHVEVSGVVHSEPRLDSDNIAPAGAIYSTANEMTRWLLAHLNDGNVENNQVLPAAVVREMQTPQNLNHVPVFGALEPGGHFHTYGLGWSIHDFDGRVVVSHGGQTQGMTAQVGMVPEEGLGFVILTNAHTSLLPPLIEHRLYEIFLGDDPTRWDRHFQAFKQLMDEMTAAAGGESPGDAPPALDQGAYAGTYQHDLYGPATVRLEGGRLTIALEDLGHVGQVEHAGGETFRVTWETGDQSLVGVMVRLIEFGLDERGDVESLSMGFASFRRTGE